MAECWITTIRYSDTDKCVPRDRTIVNSTPTLCMDINTIVIAVANHAVSDVWIAVLSYDDPLSLAIDYVALLNCSSAFIKEPDTHRPVVYPAIPYNRTRCVTVDHHASH